MRSRTDIGQALECGDALPFFRDRMDYVKEVLASRGKGLDLEAAAAMLQCEGSLDPDLYGVLLDAKSVSTLYNTQNTLAFDLVTYQEMIVSLGCRLLRFDSLQDPVRKPALEESFHLGLLFFMMSLFLQFSGQRVLELKRVTARLRQVIERLLTTEESDGESDKLNLWVLFMGGIWVSAEVDREWLFSGLQLICKRLQLTSWSETRPILAKFPWVEEIHDRAGELVWEEASKEWL